MVKLIQQFVSCCRAAGMRVSTSEVLDSLNQMKLIDPTDERQFRSLLRSNFAKSMRDVQHFDRLYHLFFHEMRIETADIRQAASYSDQIKQAVETLKRIPHDNPIFDAVVDFLQGNPMALLREMRRIQTEEEQAMLRFNLGPLSDRVNIMLQINRAASAAQALVEDHYAKTDSVTARELADHFEERVNTARSMLVYEPDQLGTGTRKTKTEEQRMRGLGEKSFSSFSREEIEEMRDTIDKLVHKLKNIVSRRYAVRNRGSIDVKKTLRASAKYNGVPVEVKYRHRAKRKSRIVTLCDVSGSVWAAARFMLNLLYSLQDCFDKVNSFVFIDHLHEVTPIFEENEINEAIRTVLASPDINFNASTDYGETLRNFKRDYMELLTKKTTLIIVGDGRTNYMNPEDAILGQMRERCRRVIWLNPEQENLWGSGDSEIRSFMPHCHEVRQCRNVNQLFTFIEELVL
ncbi:MAG TPA: VWA domain-containing protein [Smithella sp.]|nr:VWA domain-containing protein [Smithella sp.]MDM7988353.1 VWA domain-containing protein [Smithella sp.]HNY49535.1 VWA domain-containing protein [Smithella sp.]HOG89308.1 VWA domain-containing protein [Smithella sp.]HOU50673.1 VWA domain-containing protein [Smithella sp.]